MTSSIITLHNFLRLFFIPNGSFIAFTSFLLLLLLHAFAMKASLPNQIPSQSPRRKLLAFNIFVSVLPTSKARDSFILLSDTVLLFLHVSCFSMHACYFCFWSHLRPLHLNSQNMYLFVGEVGQFPSGMRPVFHNTNIFYVMHIVCMNDVIVFC